jgi:hypothetical protein
MTTPAPEDHRRSLADLAQRDLDAALQLLAERAQYITAASGAAIALRRGDHHDMLCRASAGSNAPELGAILSMDYGLSGESVRTRQLLRCDDVSSDSRVNHEVCRRLGIASVVVMPIVSDDQTLGVFELLSGKPRAFEERDLSALRRLSELVEHAVKHAVLAQSMPSAQEADAPVVIAEPQPSPSAGTSAVSVEQIPPGEKDISAHPAPAATSPATPAPVVTLPSMQDVSTSGAEPSLAEKAEPIADPLKPQEVEPENQPPAASPTKPRFWSLATHSESAPATPSAESARVPPGLRNLQKCQACGFPVSQGRTHCVECEEKQWRGQPLTKPAATAATPASAKTVSGVASQKPSDAAPVPPKPAERSKPEPAPAKAPRTSAPAALTVSSPPLAPVDAPQPSPNLANKSAEEIPIPDLSTIFQSSNAPSESWFSANKYVLIALLAVAIVIAAIAFLH